ncbi:hypothetical protein ACHAXM_005115 [Skeletonema potamos]
MKEAPHQRYIAAGALLLIIALAAVIGNVESTTSFRVCFGALLLICCVAQLKVAIDLYKNRSNLSLQLFQPGCLSMFVTSGAVATITSFLFAFPEYDATCALRQPIILTCITLMGNLLIARAWRIGCIISSAATFAASSDNKVDTARVFRSAVVNVLSRLSHWGRHVGSCGKAGSNTGIRKTITFADSIFVAVVLLVPQLVLQIVNLSLPSVRMESVQKILEGEGQYTCESKAAGSYFLIVGIVLASTPFGVSLLINVKTDGIPDNFRELDEIIASIAASFRVLVTTLPTVGLIGQMQPHARAYLLAASVLSFVLPLFHNIAQVRLKTVARVSANSKQRHSIRKSIRRLARRFSGPGSPSPSRNRKVGDDLQILKAADETAVMGKMFETMGSTSKAVAMNRDILTLFKAEEDFSWETGFTSSEIDSLGPKSLIIVVKTLIGSTRLWHSTFYSNSLNEEAKRRGIKCCMDALHIFDKAPAKKHLSDRSVVFPGYSLMNVIAKSMPYTPPNNKPREEFEETLAENFVKEACYQQYHQCRALAFQADILRRHGEYEGALLVINKMKSIYNPQLHSRAILKEYVTDSCSEIVAVSTFWLHHFGRNDEALRLCDELIETMLPEIEATELVTKLTLLTPICRVLANQRQTSTAKKALELFRKHVADPAAVAGNKAHPSVTTLAPPIVIMLKCYSSGGEAYADLNGDIAYMLNRKDPDWTEMASVSYFDAAWSTMCAETCLCLAKITGCNNLQDKSSAIIKEGLKCLDKSAQTLVKKDGKIVSQMAHSYYLQILSELENISAPV